MAQLTVKLRGGHTSSSLCVDAKPDGSLIVSGGEDGELCIWGRDGSLQQKVQNCLDDCTSVVISQLKENILYASFGNVVKVIDARNPNDAIETFQFNEEEINQIALDEKETFLAACDDSGEIKIISLSEHRLYKTLRRKHTNICSTVCFRGRKPWEVFSGGMDYNLLHWDFSRIKCLNQFNMQELQDTPSELGAYMINPPFIHHLTMSPNAKHLAVALDNGGVTLFDTAKRQISELFNLHAHSHGVSQVIFINDFTLMSGGNDSTIALWDISKANELPEGGQEAATNGHTLPIHLRNAEITENCRMHQIEHNSKINWMKYFSENGNRFVVVSDQTPELTIFPIAV